MWVGGEGVHAEVTASSKIHCVVEKKATCYLRLLDSFRLKECHTLKKGLSKHFKNANINETNEQIV